MELEIKRNELTKKVESIRNSLLAIAKEKQSLTVVQAPPGSGKTRLLVEVAILARKETKLRIAVATQTNSQADELCEKLVEKDQNILVWRFASESYIYGRKEHPSIHIKNKLTKDNPDHAIIVATSAKWGSSSIYPQCDLLFIEESWQLSYADYLLFSNHISKNIIMIGDPGQISPVVKSNINRWATHSRGPHLPAPDVIFSQNQSVNQFCLPATYRLPYDTAELVKGFYNFHFEANAQKGERYLTPQKINPASIISQSLKHLKDSSIVAFTTKTPKEGPPQELDHQMVSAAIKTTHELLKSEAILNDGWGEMKITPEDIAIIATHRKMVNSIALKLGDLKSFVTVDTPERLQGLERKVIIIVHPLSGTTNPSGFDLTTGRLCVMISRHKVALIILTRDHLTDTLNTCFPSADHPFSKEDCNGKGLFQNQSFWNAISNNHQVIPIDSEFEN